MSETLTEQTVGDLADVVTPQALRAIGSLLILAAVKIEAKQAPPPAPAEASPLTDEARAKLIAMARARGPEGESNLDHILAATTHEQGVAIATHLKTLPKKVVVDGQERGEKNKKGVYQWKPAEGGGHGDTKPHRHMSATKR
jgi:hypothetical protein